MAELPPDVRDEMPPPVDDRYRYWNERPPELSDRCMWWLEYLANNTLTKRQLVDLTPFCANYDDSAKALGVYLWEWHHILYHVIGNRINEAKREALGSAVERNPE